MAYAAAAQGDGVVVGGEGRDFIRIVFVSYSATQRLGSSCRRRQSGSEPVKVVSIVDAAGPLARLGNVKRRSRPRDLVLVFLVLSLLDGQLKRQRDKKVEWSNL